VGKLLLLWALLGGCVETLSDELTCRADDDCSSGRTCEQGFCVVVPEPSDAAVEPDAQVTPPDAGLDAAPPARPCLGGDRRAKDAANTCFVVFGTPRTFAAAATACAAESMTLAIVRSPNANQTIQSLVTSVEAFLGATDAAVEGQFRWPDNTSFTFTNFRSGEPNNGNGNEDCVIIQGQLGGVWDDRPCAGQAGVYPYVCSFDNAE
jgi:hypothetical protein